MTLEVISHQDSAFRTERGLAVLPFDTAAQLNDLASQLLVWSDLHHHPFKKDRLVREDRPTEPNPELQAQHGALLRKMRRGQRQEQCGRVGAAGGRPAETRGLRKLGVVVYRVVVARSIRELDYRRRGERDLGRESRRI